MAVSLSFMLAACATTEGEDMSSEDEDLSVAKKDDLSAKKDLKVPRDLTVEEEDLTAEEEDLTVEEEDLTTETPDLATSADLTGMVAPDLTGMTPPDLAAADRAVAPPDLVPQDLVSPPDMVPPGKVVGASCAVDEDCRSKLCRAVLPGGLKICVLVCKAQAECASFVGSYCAPIVVGGTDGFCVPLTTKSCVACAADTTCGVMNERCYKPTGTGMVAGCASDCSISGDAGCPATFSCTSVSDGGKARRLCLPKSGACPVSCTSAATCPGSPTTTYEPACLSSLCSYACKGENYDVDGDITNGCEVPDAVPPGHDKATAKVLAEQECYDSTKTTFKGQIVSDVRVHQNPVVGGFSTATGSAPDFWKVKGIGKLWCFNTYDATFTIAGGTPGCGYKLTIETNKNSASATIVGSGTATINSPGGSNQWTNDSDIFFIIEKVCAATTLPSKAAQYTVTFNL